MMTIREMRENYKTRTTKLVAYAVLSIGLALGGPAAAQSFITVTQTADAQPRNIMPTRAGNSPWVKNVFETLTLADLETFEPRPLLATDWVIAEDGLSISLNLRDDVTFHSGRKMTAEDVKFSLETAALPETALQTGFIARNFTNIDVTSDTALTITFSEPLSNVFDLFEEAYIVDKETYAQREDGSQLVGTGPYRFDSWTPGAAIILKRFDGYRNADSAQIEEIEFAVIPDPTASISALRSSRSVLAYGLPQRDTALFNNNPQYRIIDNAGVIFPFGVNVTMPPFDNKTVRQALGYAVDRERINDQVFGGSGTPTALFWSPGSVGYSEELANRYPFDPERATAMIKEAGAEGTEIEIIIPAIARNKSVFEIVQNNLRSVGLNPKALVLDVADYDKRQVAGDLGAAFLLIHGQVGLGASTLLDSLPSLREGNPSGLWTEEYVALRKAVRSANTPDETSAAIKALSEYMVDEAFILSLVQTPGQIVISNAIEGVKITRRGQLMFANARFAE